MFVSLFNVLIVVLTLNLITYKGQQMTTDIK